MAKRSFVGVAAAPMWAPLVACDPGKAVYEEAATLEEQGQLETAAAKYDAVCVHAPTSQMCPPSKERAGQVRLKLADGLITALKFADAETALKAVVSAAEDTTTAKATDRLKSPAMMSGLRWERASARPDKKNALPEMEAVAATDSPVSAKAQEWLTKERPAILLDAATAACAPTPTPNCPEPCNRLLSLHPGTPEAAKAKDFLASYNAGEAVRVYPLLVQAEQAMSDCKAHWQQERNRQDCYLRMLAADPDNSLYALSACGGNYAGDDAAKQAKKLDEAWDALTSKIANKALTDPLNDRRKKACEAGEYERQIPNKPSAAVNGQTKAEEEPASAASTQGSPPVGGNARRGRSWTETTYCKSGLEASSFKYGCNCGKPGDTVHYGAHDAPVPPKECSALWPRADGGKCIWTCSEGFTRGVTGQ